MEQADWHIYQILTKRGSLMRDFVGKFYEEKPVPNRIAQGLFWSPLVQFSEDKRRSFQRHEQDQRAIRSCPHCQVNKGNPLLSIAKGQG